MKVALTTLNAKYIHPNLALRWLYVSRDKQHETKIFEYTIKDDLNRITDELFSFHPDVVGISVYIWNADYIINWCDLIKEKLPNCRIVLGGPEVTYEYKDYLVDSVDAILKGEGEITFWQFVNNQESIDGLVTKEKESDVIAKTNIDYLETLESPYFLKEDLDTMSSRYLYLEASRGCPYQCGYCVASLDNKIRTFSLEYLFKQLDMLENVNVKQVKFLDRTFNANKERSIQIIQKILTLKTDVSFQVEVVADKLDKQLIDLLCIDTNRFRLEVGIQSFNQQALNSVNRRQNFDSLIENVKYLRKHNVVVHCDLIGGLPYENLDSFKETYQKLWQLDCDEMQIGTLKLLKGTPIKKECEKYNIKYQKESPFEIISNDWVSKTDMEMINYVALATEKLWNRDVCKKSLWYLYTNGTFMFDVMLQIGKSISLLKKPYQPSELFKIVSKYLDSTGINILREEYYRLFKQRPNRFIECDLDKKQKHEIFMVLQKENILTQDDIRYCMFDYCLDGYQVLLYNSNQCYPTRYIISKELTYLRKEDLNERYNDSNL